ncbi:MAG TPA: peptidoglycan DD-metalloendopeptidase family protein [Xanthomonadales bacterium]|nr:peptidoglycan DD-metalloendopeptidase family protein [Xanthomonadales bacterium]
MTFRRVGVALLALAAVAYASAQDGDRAAQEAEAKQKLEAVRDAQRQVALERDATQAARGMLLGALRDEELRVAEAVRGLRDSEAELAQREQGLADLDRRERELNAKLAQQREQVAALLRSAYALGRHDTLRIVFAPERVGRIARALAYHRYLEGARRRRAEALLADLRELETVRGEQLVARDRVAAARTAQKLALEGVEQARAQREAVLRDLDARLAEQQQRLSALVRDERDLGVLLERLRDAIADIPKVLAGAEPLSALRGRMAWPVAGKVLAPFGAKGSDGHASTGMLIEAKGGTEVHAVGHGRVAYADWLKGYGLIAIVDHGDGFLSLYAHNESLLRDVGDWVDAGDALATVGASGGQDAPALYFELRHDGRPVDPAGWLARR